MNTLKHLMLNLFTLVLFFNSDWALADYKSEIINSCTAYQEGKDNSQINACKLYIDGFIDSSLLTDDGIIGTTSTDSQGEDTRSDFLKRAYQTRLLTKFSPNDTETFHQFCIPEQYDRKLIVSSLAKSIDINQLANKSFKEVLFETLIEDFPCQNIK